jgi:alpha-glucoside transport system substrate-binding protein
MRRVLIVLFAVALLVGLAAPAVAAKPAPETVTVLTPFPPDSSEGEALQAELAAYAKNRVEIVYDVHFGIPDLIDRITGPEPPDLIITPQPAALVELAPYLVDLGEFVNERSLRRDFSDYLIDLGSLDGAVLGAPIKADLKSLVWYQPAEFEFRGYTIPETFAELVALSDSMVADGNTPWCNYIESGPATGWLGTDWVEDLLLSTEGPEVYDQWVAHDVLFVDPRVEEAFERFMQMMDTPGYVWDRPNLTTTPFWFNALPLGLGDCFMHKQASFFAFAIQDFGFDLEDFATFKFPAVDTEFGDSALGAGIYLSAVNERKEVRKLARFMLSQRFGRTALADTGGWLMPNIRFDLDRYGDELTRSHAEIVQAAIAADLFRFDASDLMPPEVGASAFAAFWVGMRDLLVVPPARTIPEVLEDIDDAWPS